MRSITLAGRVSVGVLCLTRVSSQAMSCWHKRLRWKPTSLAHWLWQSNLPQPNTTRSCVADFLLHSLLFFPIIFATFPLAPEKILIVLKGLRGEENISGLCRRGCFFL
jgi:hypothetical protein